jgi:hypothetical protein
MDAFNPTYPPHPCCDCSHWQGYHQGGGGRSILTFGGVARLASWVRGGAAMLTVLATIGAIFLMFGGCLCMYPAAKAASILQSSCSNCAFFFLSALRLVFCCLKFIANFLVVTEHVEVQPIFPVMLIQWVRMLDRESTPSIS